MVRILCNRVAVAHLHAPDPGAGRQQACLLRSGVARQDGRANRPHRLTWQSLMVAPSWMVHPLQMTEFRMSQLSPTVTPSIRTLLTILQRFPTLNAGWRGSVEAAARLRWGRGWPRTCSCRRGRIS